MEIRSRWALQVSHSTDFLALSLLIVNRHGMNLHGQLLIVHTIFIDRLSLPQIVLKDDFGVAKTPTVPLL